MCHDGNIDENNILYVLIDERDLYTFSNEHISFKNTYYRKSIARCSTMRRIKCALIDDFQIFHKSFQSHYNMGRSQSEVLAVFAVHTISELNGPEFGHYHYLPRYSYAGQLTISLSYIHVHSKVSHNAVNESIYQKLYIYTYCLFIKT